MLSLFLLLSKNYHFFVFVWLKKIEIFNDNNGEKSHNNVLKLIFFYYIFNE